MKNLIYFFTLLITLSSVLSFRNKRFALAIRLPKVVHWRSVFSIIGLSIMLISCSMKKHPLSLSPLISDHMVVQHDEPMTIWGTSTPEAKIIAKGNWGAVGETSSKDSTWTLELDPPSTGGPYELIISTKDTTVVVSDIYSGEVWLASGQSNMEWPLQMDGNAETEIPSADYPGIRMFTVPRLLSLKETLELQGPWETCTPETAGRFSAVGYYFAKQIHQNTGIPVGIIHSSWGGTPAEAWTSMPTLKKLKDFDHILAQIEQATEGGQSLEDWLSKLQKVNAQDQPVYDLDLGDEQLADVSYDDADWNTMTLPTIWEKSIGNFDGIVWFRKKIVLKEDPKKPFTLSLGPIDDMDITYINGKEVGRTVGASTWETKRNYSIPEGILVKGENTIAVKVIDSQGGGGIYGQAEELKLEGNNVSVPLEGEWKYLATAQYISRDLYLLGFDSETLSQQPAVLDLMSSNTPGILYNAMIAPLINYPFKGAIWYQGEANVGRDKQYLKLFPAMVQDWRDAAGNDFPFYFVQIAPYEYSKGGTSSAGLRESQRRALEVLTNTGMAVTLDIGNTKDIHPRNKKDVGERLARWALSKDYGIDVVFSGPIYRSMETVDGKLKVTFDYADSGLVLTDHKNTGFEVAGEDGIYVPAQAVIDEASIILSSPKVSNPTKARYAWSDVAEATLFNKAGLPGSTFSTDW